MDTESFLGVKRPGRGVDHAPHLAPRLKNRAILLLPLWAFMACSRVIFTFTFTLACAHKDLFCVTRKFGVKNRNRRITVQYSLLYRCDLLSTDHKTTVSLFCTTQSFVQNAKNVFTFEPHFQMDIDVFERDFADKDGYIHKLTIEDVRT
jgi:hypothetical protein